MTLYIHNISLQYNNVFKKLRMLFLCSYDVHPKYLCLILFLEYVYINKKNY